MVKICPICGKAFNDEIDVCPSCGHILDREKYDIVGDYEPSSATNYTREYTTISAEFEDDIDGEREKNDLLKEDFLDEEWLSYLVDWGYLVIKNGKYSLTDLGKKALLRNRAWIRKKSGENQDGDNQTA